LLSIWRFCSLEANASEIVLLTLHDLLERSGFALHQTRAPCIKLAQLVSISSATGLQKKSKALISLGKVVGMSIACIQA
jgi:hypothetical protein